MYNWLVRIDTVHVGRRVHVDSSFPESGRLGDYIFLGSFKDGKYREGRKDRINAIEGVFTVLDSEIIIKGLE